MRALDELTEAINTETPKYVCLAITQFLEQYFLRSVIGIELLDVYWVYMKRRISTQSANGVTIQSTVEEEIELPAIESVVK
jgi:hypothetical protein